MSKMPKKTILMITLLIIQIFCFLNLGPIATASFSTETLKVAYASMDGFSKKDANGNVSGMIIDFLDEIAKYTNWEYEYIELNNDDLVDAFLTGEYDLVGGQYYIAGLEEYFHYPDYSMGNSKSVILGNWGDTTIQGNKLNDINGKKIAVRFDAFDNIKRLERFLEFNNLTCEIISYTKEEIDNDPENVDKDLSHYLKTGVVDLMLGNLADDTGEFRVITSFDAQEYYLVTLNYNKIIEENIANGESEKAEENRVKEQRSKEIIEKINFALDLIYESNHNFAEEVYNNNFPQYGINYLDLNSEELAYIQNKKKISVALVRQLHPFACEFDDNCSNSGFVLELLEYFAKFTNLEIEYKYYDTYIEVKNAVINNEVDMSSMYFWDAENKYISDVALSKSYYDISDMLLIRKDVNYPSDGLKCGVLNGRKLPSDIRAVEIKYYNTPYELVKAVENGKVDIAYGLSLQIEKILNQNVFYNITSISYTNIEAYLSMAISRPTDTMLLSIVNKTINNAQQTGELDKIINNNMIYDSVKKVTLKDAIYSNLEVSLILFLFLLIIILAIIFIIMKTRVNTINARADAKRYQEVAKLKSNFMSQMSHEIRTPINAIMGMTEIGKKYLEDKVRLENCFGTIYQSSQHLLLLINDVLDISKIESGKIEIHTETFCFEEKLKSVIILFDAKMRNKSIEFIVNYCEKENYKLIGDSLRLRQILTNILSNAYKFTPSGGKIVFDINTIKNVDKIVFKFQISDTGIGISEEDIKKIFDPFVQANSGNTRLHDGTGLGLTITKSLVEMMGGKIQVDSTINVGSTFTIEMPFEYEVIENDDTLMANTTTLIANNNEEQINRLTDILSIFGSKNLVARNLKEFKQILSENSRLDYLFLDKSFCVEYSKQLAKFKRMPNSQIIVTGNSNTELDEYAHKYKLDYAIRWPIFHNDIIEIVKATENSQTDFDILKILNNKKILLVEDNELNQDIAKELLTMEGAVIECANNGKEAVDTFNSHDEYYYDLILMDIQMPVMSGYDATKAIRATNRKDSNDIIIMAMTANAFKEDIEKSLEAGMNEHISKPFKLTDICTKYMKILSTKENKKH